MSPKRSAIAVAIAIAGFAIVSSALSRAPRPPATDDVAKKLRYYRGAAARYDLLFFGSSLVARGIQPMAFDAELERLGISIRSFNFGALGMLSHEGNRLLGRVLEIGAERFRFAVIELTGWSPRIEEGNQFTRRVIEWHDANETRSVIHTLRVQNGPLRTRLTSAWTHLLHFGANSLPVGWGRDAVGSVLSRDPAEEALQTRREAAFYTMSGGYRPYAKELFDDPSPHAGRREFIEDPDHYSEALENLQRGAPKLDSIAHYNTRALADQVALLRAHDVQPIYIVTPMAAPATFAVAALEAGLVPNVYLFNDVDRYPELYRRESRFDSHHLGRRGAELFSIELARSVRPVIEQSLHRRAGQ